MDDDIKILQEILNIKTIDDKVVFTTQFFDALKEKIRKILERNKQLEAMEQDYLWRSKASNEQILKKGYISKEKIINKMEQLNKEIKNNPDITEVVFKIKQQQILNEILED